MKDLRPTKIILDMDIIRTSNDLFYFNNHIFIKGIEKISIFYAKLIFVPFGTYFKLSINDCPNID